MDLSLRLNPVGSPYCRNATVANANANYYTLTAVSHSCLHVRVVDHLPDPGRGYGWLLRSVLEYFGSGSKLLQALDYPSILILSRWLKRVVLMSGGIPGLELALRH